TAWVVPGLIGPSTALLVEHALSWRYVFLILVPLVLVAGVMTAPALASLGRTDVPDPDDPDATSVAESDADRIVRRVRERAQLKQAALLVAGVGAAFVAASGVPGAVAIVLLVVGVPVAVNALVHLLPPGTLRLERGVPATVAVRGLLTFGFFAADAFVPL